MDEQTSNVSETTATETAGTTEQTTPVAAETQTPDTGTTQVSADQAPAQTEPTYLGGRFKSAEQLEAYALGLEKAREQVRQPQTAQTTTDTKTAPTVEQLKYSKSHWRNEMFKAQQVGDTDAFQKASANVDWCEEQLYDTRLAAEFRKWHGQSAAETLMREGQELLKPYQANLVPGDPLYETAMTYFNQAKQALDGGASIDQILGGLTVLAAAQKTGKTTAGVTQKATANFAEALNKAAKQAIVTGGGASTKMTSGGRPTAEQIASMSDEEFAKFERGVKAQSESVSWSRHQRT